MHRKLILLLVKKVGLKGHCNFISKPLKKRPNHILLGVSLPGIVILFGLGWLLNTCNKQTPVVR